MKRYFFLFLIVFWGLSACSASAPDAPMRVVSVYATAATRPWLADAFACAPESVRIRLADEAAEADIALRLGRGAGEYIYRIGAEDALIVTQRESPLQSLTREEAQALFAGAENPSAQIWVYAAGDDLQEAFEQAVMSDRSVTSLARMAVNPPQMLAALRDAPEAVGVLPRRWMTDDLRIVYTVSDIPVLARTLVEPQGAVIDLLACLQQ